MTQSCMLAYTTRTKMSKWFKTSSAVDRLNSLTRGLASTTFSIRRTLNADVHTAERGAEIEGEQVSG